MWPSSPRLNGCFRPGLRPGGPVWIPMVGPGSAAYQGFAHPSGGPLPPTAGMGSRTPWTTSPPFDPCTEGTGPRGGGPVPSFAGQCACAFFPPSGCLGNVETSSGSVIPKRPSDGIRGPRVRARPPGVRPWGFTLGLLQTRRPPAACTAMPGRILGGTFLDAAWDHTGKFRDTNPPGGDAS